jgi:membrane peptidoglycan carboxypeptidase
MIVLRLLNWVFWLLLKLIGITMSLAFGFVVAGVMVAVGAGLFLYQDEAAEFVPPESVDVNQPYVGAKIYDRNGVFLYEFLDHKHGIRRPVAVENVSQYMVAATIATEDANYFQNPGLNLKGLARAGYENLGPLLEDSDVPTDAYNGTGGSSITQQLAKNLYIPEEERTDRKLTRKIREAVFALELTRRYSKDQILEWYLNQISYGGIYYGVEAASLGYFGKSAKDLTLAEAALLAGIPQSPSALDPVGNPEASKERRNQVLELMRTRREVLIGPEQLMTVTDTEIDAALQTEVAVVDQRTSIQAPHFIFSQVKPALEAMFGPDAIYQDGLIVRTSLDLNLQNQVQSTLDARIRDFERSSNTHNGAATVIAPNTGEIYVYLGSRDYYRDDIDGNNDNLMSLNSPGSSFKPFVYMSTFERLGWSPGTVLDDSPVTFREADGTTFSPTNPNRGFVGNVTIRDALGNSLNVPAFKAAQSIGVPNVVTAARRYGFLTIDSHYGPSIAIGGVDLRPIDLAYGYAMIANNGAMIGMAPSVEHEEGEREVDPVPILQVQNRSGEVIWDINNNRVQKQIVNPQHAFMISNILADPGAQCMTFGCGGLNVAPYSVAVKTGTSEPFDPAGPNRGKIGETWAVGYTHDLVAVVWAGNSDNAPLTNILSTSISWRAMREIMLQAYRGRPQTPWVNPGGISVSNGCGGGAGAVGCSTDLVLGPAAPQPGSQAQAGE